MIFTLMKQQEPATDANFGNIGFSNGAAGIGFLAMILGSSSMGEGCLSSESLE